MSGSQLQVRLYRDSFNTPWGFRLQGGKDLGQPLSIQRVSAFQRTFSFLPSLFPTENAILTRFAGTPPSLKVYAGCYLFAVYLALIAAESTVCGVLRYQSSELFCCVAPFIE